ncbi:hypothetical protein [Actinacidiphila sp. bgisy160]|uniref:hypothetical protein n=1 Tax=Actinacidiphila sp. bgisy160 TaxID=3413796 RepID=UPI003D747ED9
MAYWAGHMWKGSSSAEWHSWAWLNELFGGIAGLVTGSNGGENVPASARFAALALLLWIFAAWRRALLARSAYKPGPVEVQPLQDATGTSATTPPVAGLTAQFRQQLSETSLYPPPGVPEPPEESVLDLVGDMDPDPKRLGASMMRFLARLRPKLAYRVRGELRARDQEPRYGLTVTVTSYALGGCRMTTVWGSNWEEAVSSAAYWVVASLLPVTRAGKRLPWRDWVGRDIPPELFEAVQRANQLHKVHQNDEAMHWYYKALQLDPLNPYIRFELSKVQQECGLYIDALDMIQGSLISDGQREDDYTRRLWQSFGHLRRPRYLLHLRRRPDAIEVRYAHAMLLRLFDDRDEGENRRPRCRPWHGRPADDRNDDRDLATQWCKRNGDDSRARVREGIRRRLIPILANRYWPIGYLEMVKAERLRSFEGADPKKREDARKCVEAILSSDSCRRVRLFFQRASEQEMVRLAADCKLAFIVPGGANSRTRTWTNLRICRDLLVPLELSRAWDEYSKAEPGENPIALPGFGWRGTTHRPFTGLPSPLSVDALRERVKKYLYFSHWPLRMDWPLRTESRQWQDHYNAACVYGAAMRDSRKIWDPKNDETRQKTYKKTRDPLLAEHAIDELKKALRASDSSYTTVETEKNMWLIAIDPDLADLRKTDAFRDFVGHMYPHARALSKTPPGVVQHQMATYDEQFLAAEARAMEQAWHRRSGNSCADIHSMIEWFRKEKSVWDSVEKVAAVSARDWPTRVALIREVRKASPVAVTGMGNVPPGIPSPEDLEGKPKSKDAPKNLPDLLDKLHTDLNGRASVVSKSQQWLDKLLDADASGVSELPPKEAAKICHAYAATWQRLGEWFESPNRKSRKRAQRSFETSQKRIPGPPPSG